MRYIYINLDLFVPGSRKVVDGKEAEIGSGEDLIRHTVRKI